MVTRTVEMKEAREKFDMLIRRVSRGHERILIARRGKPVAVLCLAPARRVNGKRRAARKRNLATVPKGGDKPREAAIAEFLALGGILKDDAGFDRAMAELEESWKKWQPPNWG